MVISFPIGLKSETIGKRYVVGDGMYSLSFRLRYGLYRVGKSMTRVDHKMAFTEWNGGFRINYFIDFSKFNRHKP